MISEKFALLSTLFHPGWTDDDVSWEYEDELPQVSKARFSEMFDVSEVLEGVRMYPYITISGSKQYFPLITYPQRSE